MNKKQGALPKQALLTGAGIAILLFFLGLAISMDHFLLDQLLVCSFILLVILACRIRGTVF
ncbi:hypothetical protein [Robiginitalea sp. SC105]|uniref:hypothetical protein n=1 Tax=Robiginitalea sp. SC105 TaxID=2762332 RepID=UPI00163AD4BC|nr:hypothetical protein [Robiginitalea sp. SC105]MBC2838459.1 hypothetical protein [Robiginitalea sp. SC105]